MRSRFPAVAAGLVAAALLTAPPAPADTVWLHNGGQFAGVVAEETAAGIRIRLPYGELLLPAASVRAVEKEASGAAEYLARRDRLRRLPDVAAADWLSLALWARAHELPAGEREAARMAADLDPALEGLAPIMRGLGYSFDVDLETWLPHEERMRRRGYVLVGGAWVTLAEAEEGWRRREAAAAEAAARAREARAARAMDLAELLLVHEAIEQGREAERPPVALVPTLVVSFPGTWGPGVPIPGGFAPGGVAFPFQSNREAFPSLLLRQPGSLLPIGPGPGGTR